MAAQPKTKCPPQSRRWNFLPRDKNLWMGRLSLGYDVNGKRVRKYVYAVTRGQVAEELRKLQAEYDAGRLVETEELTVGQYLMRWLANTAKNAVRPATWERYRQLVENYLVPILGGFKLAKPAALHVEQLYAEMERGNPKAKRKPAGAHTGKFAAVVLGIAFATRSTCGCCSPTRRNVKKGDPPAGNAVHDRASQAKRFLNSEAESELCLRPGSRTGARQGELLAASGAISTQATGR